MFVKIPNVIVVICYTDSENEETKTNMEKDVFTRHTDIIIIVT